MDRLGDHCDELVHALTRPEAFASTANGTWLAERYQEIVPAILPDVLMCLETGQPLAASSVEAIKRSAGSTYPAELPLRTVLHGGIPALRVFTAFLQTHHSGMSAARMATLLGRASLVATELGACWASSWARADADPRVTSATTQESSAEDAGGTDAREAEPEALRPLDVVPVPGRLDQPDLDMVLLAAQGQSNEEIAKEMDYSPQAVKWHLGRIMRNWKVRNRTSLVAAALLRGVIRPRPGLNRHRRTAPDTDVRD